VRSVCSAILWSAATPRFGAATAPDSTLGMAETEYSVYIVRCGDDTYYTGISQDVARRIVEHDSSPRGAKYLKGRGPLTLVFSEAVGDRALIKGTKALQDVVLDQGSDAG